MHKFSLIIILWSSSNLVAFNFLISSPQQLYQFSLQTNLSDDQLWYRSYFHQNQEPRATGKSVVVAVLDTEISDRADNKGRCAAKALNLNKSEQFRSKTSADKENLLGLKKHDARSNRLPELTKKNKFAWDLIQKNHGEISAELIHQVAPDVTIISIPILDEYGCTNKQNLLEGLQQARKHKVDILHLGFLVHDFDITQNLDQQILMLIKKFKYVVAPAGNGGKKLFLMGFPASVSGVISVGSFGKSLIHSDFCQATERFPVDFVMPGESIWASLWVNEIQDYVFAPICGTSFSAAFMTGLLACVLEKNNNRLSSSRIIKLLELCSYKRDVSWDKCVKCGMPEIDTILLHLDRLIGLNKKNVDHYFRKLRNSMSR